MELTVSAHYFPFNSIGAAQCLGELYRLFGRRITSGLLETAVIATKLMKYHEVFNKVCVLGIIFFLYALMCPLPLEC